MKVNYMALIMSGLFSSGLWAAANNHPTDIEKRLGKVRISRSFLPKLTR